MTPRAHAALLHWLEYIQPRTWKWWIDGGYTPADLGGQHAGRGQRAAITVPAFAPEPTDREIKCVRGALGRAFRQERGSQKAISELLPKAAANLGTVQVVMHDGGPSAEPVGVQGGQIAQNPGDTGKVSDEPHRND